ncbi:MAG: hypothetical protein L6R39_000567 [Caloplaca ligustica]|nr:MAG: hypothetical protein L6R39_000567 [Caloplaca ligustica]
MDLENSGVSVFFPTPVQAATNLQNATLFTRLNARATPQAVKAALESTPTLRNTFCLGHLNNVLIFGSNGEDHCTHVRAVLQMMRDKGMTADIHKCAFTKPKWDDAGFHIERVRGDGEAFMVVLREHLAPDALAGLAGS